MRSPLAFVGPALGVFALALLPVVGSGEQLPVADLVFSTEGWEASRPFGTIDRARLGPGGEVAVLDVAGAPSAAGVFGPSGELQWYIESSGQGPNEVGALVTSIAWAPGPEVWLLDMANLRIHRFGSGGRRLPTIPAPRPERYGPGVDMAIFPTRMVYAAKRLVRGPDGTQSMQDALWTFEAPIGELPGQALPDLPPSRPMVSLGPDGRPMVSAVPRAVFWDVSLDGVVVATSDRYEASWLGGDSPIASLDVEGRRVTRAELAEIRASLAAEGFQVDAVGNDRYPVLAGVFVDADRLWVVRGAGFVEDGEALRGTDQPRPTQVDVYDVRNGDRIFSGMTPSEFTLLDVRANRIAGFLVDETGVRTLAVFEFDGLPPA